ncbi:MAG: hypothetical protein ACK52K_17000 [Alphaproteobacteria bacterium]|jgi:hypothetical protein
MADNVIANSGSGGPTFATDEIGGVHFPRSKMTFGVDGVSTDVSGTNPLPSAPIDPSTATSFGPITAANTVLFAAIDTADERSIVLQLTGGFSGGVRLQASQDSTTWFDVQGVAQGSDVVTVDTVYGPDVVVVPVVARWFRAITTSNFLGSVSGSYSVRLIDPAPYMQQAKIVAVDPAVSVPVAGDDPSGYTKRLAVNEFGHIIPADGRVVRGSRTSLGVIVQGDATGYNTIAFQTFNASGTQNWSIVIEFSNDGTTWAATPFWSSTSTSLSTAPLTLTSSAAQFITSVFGRFFRFRCSAYTTGAPSVIAVLKQAPFFPPISSTGGLQVTTSGNTAVNVAQIAGTATVTAGVAGMLAVGGNIAEDTAATSNPLICGGVVRTALPASTVIAGDAIRQTFSRSGQVITKQNAPGDLDFFVNATVTTNAQTALRGAQGADIRQNVTAVTYQNTNATATTLTIQDGSTTLVTFSVPVSMTEPRQLVFPTPLRGTANTALNYTAGTTGANVLLNVTGFNSY